jgi:hypothetical protein
VGEGLEIEALEGEGFETERLEREGRKDYSLFQSNLRYIKIHRATSSCIVELLKKL